MNTVGIHIRKLRKQRGISQETLAGKLSVTRQAVSQWERGKTQPDIDMLTRIAQVFGADIHEVIYGKKQKETPRLTPRQRKRYWTRFIIFGAIALVVGVTSLILKHSWSSWVVWPQWYIDHYHLYWFFAKPIFYMAVSFGILNGCSLLWDIHIRSWMIRNIIFTMTIAFFMVYIGILLFHTWFFLRLLSFTTEYPAIFLLPGIGMFFGLNGRRKKREATDALVEE